MDTTWNLPDTLSSLDTFAAAAWLGAFVVFFVVGFSKGR
jgi:hypothetical protein